MTVFTFLKRNIKYLPVKLAEENIINHYMNALKKGASSLLFLIPTYQAFMISEWISWKLANAFLVVASFLCNAHDCSGSYVLLDYFAIFLVSTSYIHCLTINFPLFASLLYEWRNHRSIELTKNVAFVLAVTKSNVYTFWYVDTMSFYLLLSSTLVGVIVYGIRYYLHQNDYHHNPYHFTLTWVFHVCITNVLTISSMTTLGGTYFDIALFLINVYTG